jgi:hypothetical protein
MNFAFSVINTTRLPPRVIAEQYTGKTVLGRPALAY